MASTELLASKIVVLEEEPSIPAITALPSAVCLCLGITERGPIADRTLVTSFQEYWNYFGGFTVNSEVAIAAWGYFQVGGSFMWVSRTTHFTDLTNRLSYTATTGSKMLQNSGTAAAPASIQCTGLPAFNLEDGDVLSIRVGGVGLFTTVPFNGTPATLTDTATYPIVALTGGETMGVTVEGSEGSEEQTITAVGGETTALDIAALINSQIRGANTTVSGGQVQMTTDIRGLGAQIQVTTGGTLNAILGFPTSASIGGGNVQDIDQIESTEVDSIVEAALPTSRVIVGITGELEFQTVATGSSAKIEIGVGTSARVMAAFGIPDNLIHSGTSNVPEDTLLIEGKTPGAYTDDLKVNIAAASSGVASEFNLQVLVDGTVREVFPNLTMGDGVTPDLSQTNYVERIVNHVTRGSNLIKVTDQLLSYVALSKRPVDGLSASLTGGGDGLVGIADSDYLGNQAGPTGLYCFNQVTSGRILIVPGKYTAAILIGMLSYAESYRNGSMFCILDCPPQYTAAQMNAWMDSSGLTELSEFGAIYWPRIKVANPAPAIFGDDNAIAIANSGWIAGKYAANDQKLGGVYEAPAGIGSGFGIIPGVLGVEDDPSGGSEHEVLDEAKRDLIAPKRINPIVRFDGTPWHIDGSDTLKSTGNFPSVGERRGVIFIEQTVKAGLIIVKHRFNNPDTRRMVGRIVTRFLLGEMKKGAFRSQNPAEAFFVDVSDQLNPMSAVFAGKLTVRMGLATNKPAKFIIILVTQDTRALQAELEQGR